VERRLDARGSGVHGRKGEEALSRKRVPLRGGEVGCRGKAWRGGFDESTTRWKRKGCGRSHPGQLGLSNHQRKAGGDLNGVW